MTKVAKESQRASQSPKKPYARPRLVEYGNVAKLTASGGSKSFSDGMTRMPG
jgi:hypothetical protein